MMSEILPKIAWTLWVLLITFAWFWPLSSKCRQVPRRVLLIWALALSVLTNYGGLILLILLAGAV